MKTLIITSLIGALFISGCATTPQSRVNENPGLFDSFTAEQKEIILKGEVDLGFTPEMVLMAAGVPDRKAKKRSKNGSSEVWTYYQYTPRSIHGFGNYGSYYSYNSRFGGWYRNGYWGDHVIISREGEREKNLVVEFQRGEIISFEMVQ
ncbi:MAG: hypothetical protein O3C43_03260 [Verrucomicrobia bacterium]|nr:hypothetical protein [Verrucomicrobiota bacterium]MDA1065502.1 hypothetical protein [Verrucomicrobiota bacterium]